MSWDDTYTAGRHLLAVLSNGTLTICDIARKIALQSYEDLPLDGIVKFSASSDHLCVFSSSGFYMLDPTIRVRESAGVVLRWGEPKLLEAFLQTDSIEGVGFAYPYVGVATKDEAQVHVFHEFHNPEANEKHFRAFQVLSKQLSGTGKCLLSFSASGNFVALSEKKETFIYALPRKFGPHTQHVELKQYSFANHPGVVAKLAWRPDGYEYRELLLVVLSDSSSEIYSFLHEHTHPTDAVQTADLVAQITDFAGAPSAFTWVRHEPVPSAESSLRQPAKAAAASKAESKDLTDPANPNSIRGAWLMGVGTDRVVRLWCLHPGKTGELQCRSFACGLLCVNIVGVDTTELVVHSDRATESIPQSALVQLRRLRAVGYFHLSGAGRPTRITCISEAHLFDRDAPATTELSFFDRSYSVTSTGKDAKCAKEVQLLVSEVVSIVEPDPGIVLLEEVELTQMGTLRQTHDKRICITHLPELCFCSGPYPSLVFDAWSPNGDRSTVMLQPQVLMAMDQCVQWSNTLMHLAMCAEDTGASESKIDDESDSESRHEGRTSANIYSGHAVCRSLPYHHPSKIKLVCESLIEQPYLEFKWVSFSQARIEAPAAVADGDSSAVRTSLFNDSIGLLHVGSTIHLLCLNLSDHVLKEETVEVSCRNLQIINDVPAAGARGGTGLQLQTQLDRDWLNVDDFQDGPRDVVVFPDPQHGLGLRLRLSGGDIVVGDFKRNPTTGAPLPAEATGAIHPGDKLLAVNGIPTEHGKLDEAVQLIRSLRVSAQRAQVTLRIKSTDRQSRRLRQPSGIVSAGWFLSSLKASAATVEEPEPVAVFRVERPTYWSILGSMRLESPIVCYDVKPLVGESPSQPRVLLVTAQRAAQGVQLVVYIAAAVPFKYTAIPTQYCLDETPADIQLQLLGELHARAYVCMQGGSVSVYSIRIGEKDVRFEHSVTLGSNRISPHKLPGDQSSVTDHSDKAFLGSYISSSALPEMFHLHADIVHNELMVARVGADLPKSQQVVSTLHTRFHGFPGWCSRNDDTLVVGGYGHIVSFLLSTGEYNGNIECVSGPFTIPPFMFSELINSCLKAPSPWSSCGLKSEPIANYQGGMPDWHPLHLCAILFVQNEAAVPGVGVDRCVRVLHKLGYLLQDHAEVSTLNDIFPIVLDIGFSEQAVRRQLDASMSQDENDRQDALQGLRRAVEPIVQQYFALGGVSSVLRCEVEELPQPLQTLTVQSMSVLYAIATALADHLLPMNRPGPAGEESVWQQLDVSARHTIKGYIIFNELYRLYLRHRIMDDRDQFLRMPPTLWLSAMISGTQKQLLDMLLQYIRTVRQQSAELNVVEEEVDEENDNSAQKKPKFKSTLFDELTVLGVPYWYHDMDDLRTLIQDDANATFKANRSTMEVLCHYVFLGRVAKLVQLTKTDSSISGVQLGKLLSFDFTSERGKAAAQKNAFALLRKQQYMEAAAVFLLPNPPLLHDATRVLEKNLSDPTLALLVARLLEPSTIETTRGAVLGPRAIDIVKGLASQTVRQDSTPHEFRGLIVGQDPLWVPAVYKLVIALWSEDAQAVDAAAIDLADCISKVSASSPDAMVRSLTDLMQLLTAELAVFPLGHMTAGVEVRERTLKNMATLLQTKGISTDLAMLIPSIMQTDQRTLSEMDAFRTFCRKHAEKQAGPLLLRGASAKSTGSGLFNFAAKAPSTATSSAPASTSGSRSMLDDFDYAPPSRPAAAAARSMLDDFDCATPQQQPAAAAPRSMLDDFDYVPPSSTQSSAPSFNFARAPTNNGPSAAPVQSSPDIFADFDVPQVAKASQKSIFDDFEPAPNVVRSAASTTQDTTPNETPTIAEHVRVFTNLDGASLPAVARLGNATVVEALSTIGYDIRQRCLQELIYALRVIDVKHPLMIRADLHRLLHLVIEHAAFHLGPNYFSAAFQSNINDLAQRFREYLLFLQAKSDSIHDSYDGNQLVNWLCEDLVWWLGDTGRQIYPIIMVYLYRQMGDHAMCEEVIVATSVKLLQVLRPGLMDIMNGAGEASELLFRAERLRALSLASQLQKAIALHLVGGLELHSTTVTLACAAVRTGLMFGAIGTQYDVVHKILKHYSVTSSSSEPRAETPTDRAMKWRYVREVSRHKAEELLKDRRKGTFLLRPWTDKNSNDSSYGLSFSTGTTVKHAIIRVETDSDGTVSYKCGQLGPFPTLYELLSIISTIVSCGLSFDEADYPPTADGSPLGPEPNWAEMDVRDGKQEPARRKEQEHADEKEDEQGGKEEEPPRTDSNWMQLDPNRELWASLRRLMSHSLKHNWEATQHAENRATLPTLPSASADHDEVVEYEAEEGVLDRGILSLELRTVMNLLVLKAFYKQLVGMFEVQFPEKLRSVVAGILAVNGKWPRGCSRFETSPPPKRDVPTMLLSSLRRLIQTTESALLHGLCPRLEPSPPQPGAIPGYEKFLKELLNPRTGVACRYVQVKSNDEQDQGKEVYMYCFSADDAAEWLVANKLLPNLEVAHQMLQQSAEAFVLQRVNVLGSDRVQYHYLDPWEVSAVDSAVHTAIRMGRHWYGPVPAFGASQVITDIVGEWQLGQAGGSRHPSSLLASWRRPCPYWSNAFFAVPAAGASSLWDKLRGEAWLVSMLTTSFPPEDRDWGLVDKSDLLSRSGEDTFQKSVWLHCYRNALLRRLYLPHRFVAFLEVELLELKNLSPNFKPHPMDVLACIALTHDGSPESRRFTPRTGATDFYTTGEKKLWAMPASPARYPEQLHSEKPSSPVVGAQSASQTWQEKAMLRFPLMDTTSTDGPVASFDKPPQCLQISVFEKKGFFGDQRLGDAIIDLTDLSDTKPFTKFVGLSLDSANYTYWFINVQVSIRYMLMTIDEEREREHRAIRLTTKRKRKLTAPHFHFRQNTRSNVTLEVFDRRTAIFRRQTTSADAPRPKRVLRLESDVSDTSEHRRTLNPFRRHRPARSEATGLTGAEATSPRPSKGRPEKIGTSKVPTAAELMKKNTR